MGNENTDIRYEAVMATGNWQIEAAWPQLSEILASKNIDSDLTISAIEAVPHICKEECNEVALKLLSNLANECDDKDVAESAAFELKGMRRANLLVSVKVASRSARPSHPLASISNRHKQQVAAADTRLQVI